MEITMKNRAKLLGTLFTSVAIAISAVAIAQIEAPAQTLFTNVQIFDGVNEERMPGNVLVEGNLIKRVSAEAINAPGATVIDGAGRTLMPGLIENLSILLRINRIFCRSDIRYWKVKSRLSRVAIFPTMGRWTKLLNSLRPGEEENSSAAAIGGQTWELSWNENSEKKSCPAGMNPMKKGRQG